MLGLARAMHAAIAGFMHGTTGAWRLSRLVGAAAVAGSLLASAAPALAANGAPIQPPETPERPDYWSQGRTRAFVSSQLGGGAVYAKPQIALGYGKPFWSWFGIEAYALSTNSFAAGYAGVRGALPFANITLGVRESYSYLRSFLPVRDHYSVDDLARGGPRARYFNLEAEAFLAVPVPGGYAAFDPLLYVVTDAPRHRYLYEESIRAIIHPPYVWAARLAYLLALGSDEQVKLGPLFEVVGLPGRGTAILRAGPIWSAGFTDHFELIGTFSMVLSSPDSLGIWHGPFGLVGVRYLFATGE